MSLITFITLLFSLSRTQFLHLLKPHYAKDSIHKLDHLISTESRIGHFWYLLPVRDLKVIKIFLFPLGHLHSHIKTPSVRTDDTELKPDIQISSRNHRDWHEVWGRIKHTHFDYTTPEARGTLSNRKS